MAERIKHNTVQKCKNTDRSVSLASPHDDYDLALGRIDRPGSDFCGECQGEFDDPEHGQFSQCPAKTAHVCRFAR